MPQPQALRAEEFPQQKYQHLTVTLNVAVSENLRRIIGAHVASTVGTACTLNEANGLPPPQIGALPLQRLLLLDQFAQYLGKAVAPFIDCALQGHMTVPPDAFMGSPVQMIEWGSDIVLSVQVDSVDSPPAHTERFTHATPPTSHPAGNA